MLMILTCKYTSFAYDYSDGGMENKRLSIGKKKKYPKILLKHYFKLKKKRTTRKKNY
jgi:hypothetical protein